MLRRSESRCLVQYVDYGNEETVSTDDVQRLTGPFRSLRAQAMECALSGLESEAHNESATEAFAAILQKNNVVKMQVVARSENKLSVKLFNNDTNVDVNEEVKKACGLQEAQPPLRQVSPETMGEAAAMGMQQAALRAKAPEAPPLDSKPAVEVQEATTQPSVEQPVPKERTFVRKSVEGLGQVQVYLPHGESASKFYLHLVSEEERLGEMTEDLNGEYSALTSHERQLQAVREGSVCVARFSEDESWYRATVVACSGDQATVRFLDFGNTETCGVLELKEVNEKYLDIPAFAVECCLDDASSSDEVNAKVLELADVEDLWAEFVKSDADPVPTKLLVNGQSVIDTWGLQQPAVDEAKTEALEYKKPMLEMGTRVDVILLSAESLSCIYLQLAEDSSQTLVDQVHHVYSNLSSPDELALRDPAVGKPCVARYSTDESWYRATITSLMEDQQQAEVLFVDFGNKDVVAFSELKEIQQELMEAAAPFAILCRVREMEEPSGGWSPQMCADAQSLLMDEEAEVMAEFHKTDGDVMDVDLFVKNSAQSEPTNVVGLLCDNGRPAVTAASVADESHPEEETPSVTDLTSEKKPSVEMIRSSDDEVRFPEDDEDELRRVEKPVTDALDAVDSGRWPAYPEQICPEDSVAVLTTHVETPTSFYVCLLSSTEEREYHQRRLQQDYVCCDSVPRESAVTKEEPEENEPLVSETRAIAEETPGAIDSEVLEEIEENLLTENTTETRDEFEALAATECEETTQRDSRGDRRLAGYITDERILDISELGAGVEDPGNLHENTHLEESQIPDDTGSQEQDRAELCSYKESDPSRHILGADSQGNNPMQLKDARIGAACVVKFPDQWSRAVVTGLDGSEAQVQRVDVGDSLKFPVSELKEILPLHQAAAPFAFHCRLSGMKEPRGGWSSEQRELFAEVMASHCTTLSFQSHCEPHDVAVFNDQEEDVRQKLPEEWWCQANEDRPITESDQEATQLKEETAADETAPDSQKATVSELVVCPSEEGDAVPILDGEEETAGQESQIQVREKSAETAAEEEECFVSPRSRGSDDVEADFESAEENLLSPESVNLPRTEYGDPENAEGPISENAANDGEGMTKGAVPEHVESSEGRRSADSPPDRFSWDSEGWVLMQLDGTVSVESSSPPFEAELKSEKPQEGPVDLNVTVESDDTITAEEGEPGLDLDNEVVAEAVTDQTKEESRVEEVEEGEARENQGEKLDGNELAEDSTEEWNSGDHSTEVDRERDAKEAAGLDFSDEDTEICVNETRHEDEIEQSDLNEKHRQYEPCDPDTDVAPLVLPKTEATLVYVSHVESPSNFFVQLADTFHLELLSENLQQAYAAEQTSDESTFSSHVKPGMLCAAFSSDDQSWYRARVLSTAQDRAQIQLIDFGGSECVKLKGLRPLQKRFAKIPVQTVQCSLFNVGPIDESGGWSEECCETFKAETGMQRRLLAEVCSDDVKCERVDINLYVDTTSIADVLVEAEHAVHTRFLKFKYPW